MSAGGASLLALGLVALLAAPVASLRAQGDASDRRAPAGTDIPAGAQAPTLESATQLVAGAEARLAEGDAAGARIAFDRAEAELGRLLLYGHPDVEAWGDLSRRSAAGSARTHVALGEPYLARIDALRALNVDPDDAGLRALLGTTYYREARFAEAESAFTEALRLDPAHGPALQGRALLDLSANRLASARRGFERAWELGRDPESLWLLARVAFLERDYESAADKLRDYLERARPSEERRQEVRARARVYDRVARRGGTRFASPVRRGQLRFDVAKGDEVPLLPARVNGTDPVYLILDSGAQDHVLDAAFARELGLELSEPAGRVEGGLGASERRLAVIDTLDLQGIRVRDVPVSVADLAPLGLQGRGSYYVGGVLNPALLFRDFLVRVDFRRRIVELERYDQGGADYRETRPALRRIEVPFRFNADGTGIVVQAELGGSRGHPLLVDTGASDVYLSALVGQVLDLDPRDLGIALGDLRRTGLRAHFLRDLGAVEQGQLPGAGVALEGILGFPFFRDLRVVFDYYHGVLLLES